MLKNPIPSNHGALARLGTLRSEYGTTLRDFLAGTFGRYGTAALRMLPAETSHDVGMFLLKHGIATKLPKVTPVRLSGLKVTVPGLGELPHPIGLAAGFDKNCHCPDAFARLGFSFLEIGTVTPRPQPGNPKPRLFRQPEQLALINRMGFNSDGAQTVAKRLRELNWDHRRVPLGVNLGKNKTTADEAAIDDYLQGYETFRGLGQYYVINVSSPNTPGLRSLANPDFLRLMADSFHQDLSKLWVKLDPDMPRRDLQALVACIAEAGYQGIILSNTHRVVWPEVGGQSGHPIMAQATRALETAYEVHKGKLPMIASGGILSGADIYQKLIRGASAVQIYTALVYGGPWVVHYLLRELAEELKLAGFASAVDAIGSFYN